MTLGVSLQNALSTTWLLLEPCSPAPNLLDPYIMHQLFFLLLVLISFEAVAQTENQVRFGAPYSSIKSTDHYFLVDEAHHELIALRKAPSVKHKKSMMSLSMQVFNLNTLHEKHRQDKLALPKKTALLAPLYFHQTVYLFYHHYDEPSTNKQLFAQAINSETVSLENDPIPLIDNEELYNYSLTTSPNQKTLLVKGFKTLDDKKENLQLGLYSFGKDLKPLQQTLVELPYPEKQVVVNDFCIDNQGIPYLLLKVYTPDSEVKRDVVKTKIKGSFRKKNTINYHVELLTINPNDGSFKVNKIPLSTTLPKGFHLEASPNNQIYCIGHYTSKDSKTGGVQGLFVWELAPKTGVLHERYYSIPLEVMTQYEQPDAQRAQAKAALKGRAEVMGLDLNTLQLYQDSSLLINASVFRLATHSYMSNRQLQSDQVYLYQGIFVTKIHPDGTLAWMNKIPKNQQSTRSTNRLGYTYFSDLNHHYYLHMDHAKNDRLGKFDVPKVYKEGESGIVRVAILDHQTGELTRKPLIHTRKQRNRQGYKLFPFSHQHVVPTTAGKVVIEFDLERKQSVLMEVDMEE